MLDNLVIEEIREHESDPAAIPWVIDFLNKALPPNYTRELRSKLIGIGTRAYATTFIADYDSSPDGLKLSELRDLPKAQINQCLAALLSKSTAFFIPSYIEEFKRKYLPEAA